MSDDLTDKEIDAALERMAWLLGPEFVAECEKEIIKGPKTMTLGDYLKLTALLFGESSPPHRFIADKIAEQGEDEPVLADESQMLVLLTSLAEKG